MMNKSWEELLQLQASRPLIPTAMKAQNDPLPMVAYAWSMGCPGEEVVVDEDGG